MEPSMNPTHPLSFQVRVIDTVYSSERPKETTVVPSHTFSLRTQQHCCIIPLLLAKASMNV